MSELILPKRLLKMAESGKITPQNVIELRQSVFGDDLVEKQEAECLLVLDMAAKEKCPQWSDYFSQALVHYIVYQADPEGRISEENANWLIRCISRDGLVDSFERLEMLVKVIEKAQEAPEFLQQFALDQISKAILESKGALGNHRMGDIKVITASDVELIRRVLYAFGGDGGMAITRNEAEFLFELNDATISFKNDVSWSDLFVKCVGNYLLATLGNCVPSRQIALKKQLPNQSSEFSINSLVSALKSVAETMLLPAGQIETAMNERNAQTQYYNNHAAEVTDVESQWVIDRISRDSQLIDNEKALLRFLKEESPRIHPSLDELMRRAS